MSLDALLDRREPSLLELFRKQPYTTLATLFYDHRQRLYSESVLQDNVPCVTVVCISDTHNKQPQIPAGDLLIHAGDLTQSGSLEELQQAIDWLDRLPHQHKVVIAGNHDFILGSVPEAYVKSRWQLRWGSVIYLEDQSTVLHFAGGRKLSVYGNPKTRKHGSWCFQYDKHDDVFGNRIPDDTDIVITHSPPAYHLDMAGLGDYNLLQEVWRVRPKLHVFGHVHAGYGKKTVFFDSFQKWYEDICHRRAGLFALLCMVYVIAVESLFPKDPCNRATVMINAATVGGPRDDLIREPITVLI